MHVTLDLDPQSRNHWLLIIETATEAHEEWRVSAGVDPALDMRSLVTFIWSADLGLRVPAALGVDVPDSTANP